LFFASGGQKVKASCSTPSPPLPLFRGCHKVRGKVYPSPPFFFPPPVRADKGGRMTGVPLSLPSPLSDRGLSSSFPFPGLRAVEEEIFTLFARIRSSSSPPAPKMVDRASLLPLGARSFFLFFLRNQRRDCRNLNVLPLPQGVPPPPPFFFLSPCRRRNECSTTTFFPFATAYGGRPAVSFPSFFPPLSTRESEYIQSPLPLFF